MSRYGVVVGLLVLAGPALGAPVPAPPGHEVSSGVGVAEGGYITFTAVWVTPGLTDHPYYQQWVPRPETRALHRRAAASYTVMLLEAANLSVLRLEGYLSVNVRLLVDEELRRPSRDPLILERYPDLAPEQHLQRIAPREVLVKVYAFPKVEPAATSVTFVVRPLWLFNARGAQIGQLPAFDLRFDPRGLAFPP